MQPSKEEWDRMVVFNLDNIKVWLYNPLTDGEVLQDSDFWTNYRAAFWVNDIELECERISEFAEVVWRKKVDHHDWVEFKDSEGNMLEIHKI